MPSTLDAVRLMRVLAGQRIRVGERRFLVARTRVTRRRLHVELTGDRAVKLRIELPKKFDSHSAEHMARVLAEIESQLKADQ